MNTINERVRAFIQQVTSEHRRFKELEEVTGISTATWKTFWNRSSNPSAQMIEALAEQWPEYAFWLVTGVTDSGHSHIGIANAYDNQINKPRTKRLIGPEYLRQKTKARKLIRHVESLRSVVEEYVGDENAWASLRKAENALEDTIESLDELRFRRNQEEKQIAESEQPRLRFEALKHRTAEQDEDGNY